MKNSLKMEFLPPLRLLLLLPFICCLTPLFLGLQWEIIMCGVAIQLNMHPTPIQARREFHLSS